MSSSRLSWRDGGTRLLAETPSKRTPTDTSSERSAGRRAATSSGAVSAGFAIVTERVTVRNPEKRTLSVAVRAARACRRNRPATASARRTSLTLEFVDLDEVARVGLLVSDRLGVAARFDRPLVAGPRQRHQMGALRRPEGVPQRALVEVGQLPDGADPEPFEPLERDRADSPQPRHGKRVEERQLPAWVDLDHPGAGDHPLGRGARLGGHRRQLGEELVGGDSDRAPEVELSGDVAPDAGCDLDTLTEQARGARDVEEGLVEGERLDERRVALEDLVHLRADLAVQGVVAGKEHGLRAAPAGDGRGQGRMHAEPARFVRRRRHHPAAGRSHRPRPAFRASSGRRRSSTDTKKASMST